MTGPGTAADLRGANLSNTICHRTSFVHANLQGARLEGADLRGADMQFAEMTRLIRSYWWDGLQVDYKIVDSLPENSKPQVFVREMPERTAS